MTAYSITPDWRKNRIMSAICALMGGHISGMESHWAGKNIMGYGPCKACGTPHWFGPYEEKR